MKMERKNKNEKKKKGNSSSSLKVVYISSPMKVKTTASRFKALVQELTGRDSDITRSMDIVQNCNNFNDFEVLPQKGSTMLSKSLSPDEYQSQELHYFSLPAVVDRTPWDSPSSSESLIEQQEVFGNCEAAKLDISLSPDEDQYQELQYLSLLPVDGDRTPRDSPTSSESLIEQQEVFGNCEAFLSSQDVEDQFLEDVFSSSLFFEQYSQSHLLDCYDAL